MQQKVSTAFNFNLLWKSFEKCSRKERYCLSECLLCIYCCSFLRCRTFFDSNWTCLLLKYFLCYASQGYCAYFACLAGFSLHTTQIRCEHSWMNVSQQWILMYTRSSSDILHLFPPRPSSPAHAIAQLNVHTKKNEEKRSPLIFFFFHLSQLCPFFVYIPVRNSNVWVFSSSLFLGIKRNEGKSWINRGNAWKISKESFAHFFAHIFIDR